LQNGSVLISRTRLFRRVRFFALWKSVKTDQIL